MTLDDLEKLKSIFEKEISINEDNVLKMSIDLTKISSKYLKIYIKEIRIKKRMEIEKDQLYGKLYHKYKHEFKFQMDSAKEIDTYVRSDESYYQKSLELSNQETITDFLEKALEIINKAGFSVKNYIDLMKLRSGII
jgi:hypothetical protein